MENIKHIPTIKEEEEEEEEEDEEEDSESTPSKTLHPQVVSVTGSPPGTQVSDEPEKTFVPAELPVIHEIIDTLPLLDVLRISAVLEDTLDQLSILNYIMPIPFEKKKETVHKSSKDMHIVIQSLDRLQTSIMHQRKSGTAAELEGPKTHQTENPEEKKEECFTKRPARQSILTLETLGKVQADREYASEILTETVKEMQSLGTFTKLMKALEKEKEKKTNFCEIIAREEKERKLIKSLQKDLQDVKNERQVETQGRNEYIAHLKDQLQELKAKTNMESRYVKKNTDLQIAQTQKKCNKEEEVLLEEIDKLRLKTDEEIRVHLEIESFLKREQQKLEEKLEYWMEKYDKDTEAKQNELNSLKYARTSDLATLQDLAKQLREFEQVIIEDRLEKEKARKKIEQDALEHSSIIKLQAWWRGTMVRRELGNFKMPKREKDDSRDSKGKGKKAVRKR
ncbi:dynein regulatory complex protein 9 isoform X1 [Antechinus flavipes]|uniref:dynein regulatory complex protein 9 isoform X1 n=1 Tax=Antechinus flavipes TaxID=38775 RepID=UPI002236029E|nr:dynein regulatory complex protein 9 isoform X1 [Antechinus flavipes]XP_051841456.1 dynein regulatory complex protein 9 isoform X1 [Antechinus flavipes]